MTQELIPTNRTYTIIEQLATGKTHEEIAKLLSLSRSTIERELKDVRANEDLQAWIISEWLNLHGTVKASDPKECYRALTQLIKRSGEGPNVSNRVTQINIVFGNDQPKPVVVDSDEYSAE